MKRYLIGVLVIMPMILTAQTKTTEKLHKQYSDATALVFYKNTLRMVNQMDNPEFDAMIEDIEKIKMLTIEKIGKAEFMKAKAGFEAEDFEELMTMQEGSSDILLMIKEQKGKTKGMVLMVRDGEQLILLDVVGSIPFKNAATLHQYLPTGR